MVVRRDAGFTLVELLVATALMAIVVLYLMQTFTVQHRTYTVVEQVSETQQNTRAIAGLMESEVRAAGFLVPEAAAVCGLDNTNAPDVLYVSAADILDPTGVDDADVAVGITTGSGWVLGDADPSQIDLSSTTIPDGDPAAYDLDADGTNDADFAEGMGVIVVNTEAPVDGTACGRITATPTIVGTNLRLQVDWDVQMQSPAGPATYRVVPAHVYALNGMVLERDGTPLATDVEDFQVALFFDANGDGDDAAAEWAGSAAGTVYNAGDGAAFPSGQLRDLRLNFVVRSRSQDPNRAFDAGRFQETENRNGPGGADGFRRRVHTATVRLRNVGFRDLQ